MFTALIVRFFAKRLIVVLVPITVLSQTAAWFWPGALCVHWSLHASILLIPCAIAARKHWWGMVATLGVLLGVWPWIVAAYEPRAPSMPRASAQRLRVLHENIYFRSAAHERVFRGLDASTQIVSLVEVIERDQEMLRNDQRWPYQAWSFNKWWQSGVALLSSKPILWSINHNVERSPIIEAVLDVDGRRVRVLVAHPYSPMSPKTARHQELQLAALANMAAASTEPTILLGDLNITVGHPLWNEFRRKGGLFRYAHAHPATWHSWLGPIGIGIDHILVKQGIGISAVNVFSIPHSDHRGLGADIFFE